LALAKWFYFADEPKEFRMRLVVAGFAALAAGIGSAQAGDVQSGLQPGDAPPAFEVNDITGPARGTSLCYRCRYGGAPVVTIFTRKIDDNVTTLIKQVDDQVANNTDKKMRAFVVLLTDKPKADAPQLVEIAKKNKIANVPLTTYDNQEGPVGYKLSSSADLTVLMWVDSTVKASHAFKGALGKNEIDSIVRDTKQILN
jgi:hypothetical protein